MSLKIATLNLCLGLKNKKLQVKNLVTSSDIDILLLQETEIESNYDTNTLTFSGFNFEAENNSVKSRVGAYIKNEINYTRKNNLEGENSHLLIIDIEGQSNPIRLDVCCCTLNKTRYPLTRSETSLSATCIWDFFLIQIMGLCLVFRGSTI